MGIFSNKDEKRDARQFAAQQTYLGAQAQEAVKAQEARVRSAESARGLLQGMLGAPGTYDLPGAAGTTSTPGTAGSIFQSGTDQTAFDPTAYSNITNIGKLGRPGKKALAEYEREGVLDPEAYAQQQAGTSEFRMRSRLTGEAEQLLAQEGPAWDMLEQSTLGSIQEGSATQLRETMRDLKSRAAKGGTARRTALNEANQMLARESAARTRINETWQANLRLYDFTRQNAERTMEGNQRWLDNLPQLRTTYQNTMGQLAEMMSSVAIPMTMQASQAGYTAKSAVPQDYTGKMIIGLTTTLIGAAAGGAGGGSGMMGGLMSSLGQGMMTGAGLPSQQQLHTNVMGIGSQIGSFLNPFQTPIGPQVPEGGLPTATNPAAAGGGSI
jgi:hypothetical protein